MTTRFTIRSATRQDYEAIGDILNASCATLMAAAYDKQLLAAALPLITKANPTLIAAGTYLIAQTDDKTMVGCGGWSLDRPGTGEVVPGLAHIRHFATAPSWTGRGIGRALYTCCEEAARTSGATQLECYASLNAQPFYAALGFEAIGRSMVRLAPGLMLPHIVMRRSI